MVYLLTALFSRQNGCQAIQSTRYFGRWPKTLQILVCDAPTAHTVCNMRIRPADDQRYGKKSVVKLCFRIRYSKRVIYLNIPSVLMVKMVPRGGIEPPTRGFSMEKM